MINRADNLASTLCIGAYNKKPSMYWNRFYDINKAKCVPSPRRVSCPATLIRAALVPFCIVRPLPSF